MNSPEWFNIDKDQHKSTNCPLYKHIVSQHVSANICKRLLHNDDNNMTMNNDDKDDFKVELKYNTKDILQAAATTTLDDPYTRSPKAHTILCLLPVFL